MKDFTIQCYEFEYNGEAHHLYYQDLNYKECFEVLDNRNTFNVEIVLSKDSEPVIELTVT